MKTFFKSHMETMLVLCAVIFIIAILWFLFATIQTVVSQVNRAVITPTPSPQQGFDLKSAQSIDFRGIVVSSSSATASATATFPGGASVNSPSISQSLISASTTPSSSVRTVTPSSTK